MTDWPHTFTVRRLVLLVCLFSSLSAPFDAGASTSDDRIDRLTPEHKQWIVRDVVYIISERERDIFLSLETVEERNRFITSFWRKRDPNPATPDNEFRTEHERRLAYADKFLGRDTFREGWQTDRGRYYIILGEPRDIQRFSGYAELIASELWFFQGETEKGVPAFFYLLFFKRNDIGEFRLYDPVADGPHALLTGDYLPGGDARGMVRKLREVSAELAQASLSFDTSDPPDFERGRPSLGTSMMMARIEESPHRAIRTDYTDAWETYGNLVSSEYSFNFIPSRSNFAMILGPENTPFIQYNVEIDPQNFSLETDEDKTSFYTTLDVSVDARASDDQTIVALNKELFVEISPSQMNQVQSSPFSYQDSFPLVSGEYDVTVIVRNRVLKQFTVAETHVVVDPYVPGAPALTPPILGYDVRTGSSESPVKTYQIEGERVMPSAQGLYVLGETIHSVTQLHEVPADYSIEMSIVGEMSEILKTRSVSPSEARSGVLAEPFQLTEMNGGNYVMRARLKDETGTTVQERTTPFTVSPRSGIPRAQFIYRRGFNVAVPGLLSLAKGEQLWNLARFEESEAELERAVAFQNPRLPNARWKLAHAYLRHQRGDDILRLLSPLEEAFGSQYEVIAGLGFGHYFNKDPQTATDYLERAKTLRPPDANLLNALADCYQQTGQPDKARENFERSLELNPAQEMVKERLESLAAQPPSR